MSGTTSREFREYRQKLERLAKDAMPQVVAETLNNVAAFAHAATIQNVRQRFTLRNQYTERSIKFYKASPKKDWRQINAVTGSISPYMGLHDQGGARKPKRGSKVPLPTVSARGGNRNRVVRKKYYAGQLGDDMFIGRPNGLPPGVWLRKKKRLVMIRNLEHPTINVRQTRWHRDGVSRYATRQQIESEFIRQAKSRLEKQ